ncbi:hypothetical protein [Streptomyces sp. TLI_105]|nr:hypothetical protein [Streptomyces sp. TLI_105]
MRPAERGQDVVLLEAEFCGHGLGGVFKADQVMRDHVGHGASS